MSKKPRKWIDAEIARLDPEVDWVQMHRLMNTYRRVVEPARTG